MISNKDRLEALAKRPQFDPLDWYWIIAGDETQAYSSLQGGYVSAWPANRATRIASEEELGDVLRSYGLPLIRPAAIDIKAEAQRRIIALVGASDLTSCLIKQLNAQMRANELNDKRISGGTLTAEETAEADALRALAAAIKAIRAKSNEIESSLPSDYTADRHWA